VNYLVTGGAGFIGSNYVRMLLSDQLGEVNTVKVLDKLTYAGSLENLKFGSQDPRFIFVQGDICEQAIVDSCVNEGDVIVHFAAESHVDRSITGPSEFIRTNVLGTQVLLDAALRKKAKIFLHVSTDEVYGSVEAGSSVETDSLLPNSPYSASKAASDLLVRSYVQTYGLDARITRCCNNYGPNQYPEKFIPLAIKNLKEGKKIPLYGDGSNIREWIHVEDHCHGIQKVIQMGVSGEIYNIGTGDLMTNLQITNLISEAFGIKFEESFHFVEDRLGHDYRYSLDSTKIKDLLDFRPRKEMKYEINKLVLKDI
jgi:dTDP-glucose 4,6-dehydratase